MLKKETRILGIEDAPFDKFKKGNVLIIGTIFRGGLWLDGVLSTKVKVDGNNSTAKLVQMINKSKFKPQIQCILIDGIAFGGFNIIDIGKLNKKTKIPVMVIIRKYPDFKKIKETLNTLNKSNKYKLIEKAGDINKINKIYVQIKGADLSFAKDILRISCTRSLIPEPLRAAHIIASGVVDGESRGGA